jgi:hypothetical protein
MGMSAVIARCAYREHVKSDSKKPELQDDIQIILRHSGVTSPYLDRMRQVAFEMKELEWKMMKRAAAARSVSPVRYRSGD